MGIELNFEQKNHYHPSFFFNEYCYLWGFISKKPVTYEELLSVGADKFQKDYTLGTVCQIHWFPTCESLPLPKLWVLDTKDCPASQLPCFSRKQISTSVHQHLWLGLTFSFQAVPPHAGPHATRDQARDLQCAQTLAPAICQEMDFSHHSPAWVVAERDAQNYCRLDCGQQRRIRNQQQPRK